MSVEQREELLLARVRAAARAEIEWFLAGFDASSHPQPKCASLVRAWYALTWLHAVLAGQPAQSAPEFLASLGRGERQGLPLLLRELPPAFPMSVARCAVAEPGALVEAPRSQELDEHRSILLRTYKALNREARNQLPRRPVRWRPIALSLFGIAVPMLVFLYIFRPRWRVAYYPNESLSGSPGFVTSILDPDRNWGPVGPGHGLPDHNFSARYETCLVLKRPTNIAFAVGSDDGGRLFVDGQKLIDLWSGHSYTKQAQSLALEPGTHSLRLEYFQGGGDAQLTFEGHTDSGADITRMLHVPAAKEPACAP